MTSDILSVGHRPYNYRLNPPTFATRRVLTHAARRPAGR
jgi:hypothetical protein